MVDRAVCSLVMIVAACSHAPRPAPAPVAPPPKQVKLAILPAESDSFPGAAKALTESLSQAKVRGIDRTQMSKVSLEVVQLSIECVDPTADCYEAAGRSLAVNQLLFAQISEGAKRKHPSVTITLFDVDTKQTLKTAQKEFASDAEATAGVAELVAQATKP